jgi:hypothetical protein
MYEQLLAVYQEARAAGHGGKTVVYRRAADRMGVSVATLLKRMEQVRGPTGRRRRRDFGSHSLGRDEALQIAAVVEQTRRLTGTGELPLGEAVRILRANGRIVAGQVDQDTGEVQPLSESAIRRALRTYYCHPGQLAEPTAAIRIVSEHPNHFWQTDASISRQFYLADSGTAIMPRAMYYRGKPKNFQAINDRRLIRYNVTDHTSGFFRLFYALRAESAMNVIAALIHAMTPAEGIAMHGVPRVLGMDKGSRSQLVENFCAALGIDVVDHAAGNPRALGASEKAHDLIETEFEASLKLREPVTSIEELNRLADQFVTYYSAWKTHSRTLLSRRDGWLRIKPAQLLLAPSPSVLQSLALSTPKSCVVRDLTIKFRGACWDVREMPNVLNGQRVEVVVNPFDQDTVRILHTGTDGRAGHFLAPRIELTEWGFRADGAPVGEYKSMPDTPADSVRKEVERIGAQATTDAEAAQARKSKRVPFGGSIDPTLHWGQSPLPAALPRAGTPSSVQAPTEVAPVPLLPAAHHIYTPQRWEFLDSVKEIKRRVEDRGAQWQPAFYAVCAERWPDGLLEDEFDGAVRQLLAPKLTAIGGGAA